MTNTYKYTQTIALHEKLIAISEVTIRTIKRLDSAQEDLHKWDLFLDSNIRLMQKRSTLVHAVDIWTRALPWLNRYYSRIAREVCKCLPVVELNDSLVNIAMKEDLFGSSDNPLNFSRQPYTLFITPELKKAMDSRRVGMMAEQTEYLIPGWNKIVEPEELRSGSHCFD